MCTTAATPQDTYKRNISFTARLFLMAGFPLQIRHVLIRIVYGGLRGLSTKELDGKAREWHSVHCKCSSLLAYSVVGSIEKIQERLA